MSLVLVLFALLMLATAVALWRGRREPSSLREGRLSVLRILLEAGWRAQFLVGMLLGGVVLAFAMPSALAFEVDRSLVVMAAAGLLVGFGTRLGSGCTSGHGVCDLPRLSPRSLVATLTFMATGVLTAVIVGRLLGGAA